MSSRRVSWTTQEIEALMARNSGRRSTNSYGADADGTLRVRIGKGGWFELSLVAPRRGFYGLVRSRGHRQTIATVNGHRWSQLEIDHDGHSDGLRFPREPRVTTTVLTTPDGKSNLEVERTGFRNGQPQTTIRTTIRRGRRLDWSSSD